jgi:hypothetical protein
MLAFKGLCGTQLAPPSAVVTTRLPLPVSTAAHIVVVGQLMAENPLLSMTLAAARCGVHVMPPSVDATIVPPAA